jgi:hypothetical protein
VSLSHSYVSTSNSAYRNHSCACRNHICACQNHTAFENHTLRVEITLYENKSHFVFRNFTRACVHHSDFYTQSVVLTRMSVIITFLSVIITLIRVNIALCVYKSHSCVLKSYFMHVNITICV